MASKRRIESDDSHSEEDGAKFNNQDEEFTVEVITRARVKENGTCDFLVKWYGYPSDDDSWEPEEHVEGCKRLIKGFWKDIRKQKKGDIPGSTGTEHTATNAWIEKQRKLVRSSMMNAGKKVHRTGEEERPQKNKEESSRAKHIPQKSIKLTVSSDAPSKERQLVHDKVRSLFSPEISDSGSDEHLNTNLKPKPSKLDKGKTKLSTISIDSKTPSSSSKPKGKSHTMLPPIQLPPSQKSKLAGLKIPKKTASTANMQPLPAVISPVDRMDVDTPGNPIVRAPIVTSSVAPPQRNHPRPVEAHPGPIFTSTTKSPQAPSPQVPVQDADIDNLLVTLFPFSESIAQKPENLASSPVLAAASKDPRTIGNNTSWKWTGGLLLVSAGSTQKLCDISISDSTNVAEVGFRLDMLMNSEPSLEIRKVYDRFEIKSIVRALKKVDQVAKITYKAEKDRSAFIMLLRFLRSGDLAMSAPVIRDNGHVAQIVIFPSPPSFQHSAVHKLNTAQQLYSSLNVPKRYLGDDALIAVLMPWVLPPSRYPGLSLRSDELDQQKEEAQEQLIKEYRLSQNPSLASGSRKLDRAVRTLGFPEWFVSFMQARPYCVWVGPAEPLSRSHGIDCSEATKREAKLLVSLLDNVKARNVGHKADARVVFVHVGALQTVNKLEALVDRRIRPEIQFITFGSHQCVKPMFWGFDQIFPLGGVITVTATALLENPVGVADIIERAASHRLWTCYILPSVLSIFVRLSCPGDDPISTYAREPWRLSRILNFIDEGKLALMKSPPVSERALTSSDICPHEEWITAQYASLPKTTTDIIEQAWAAYINNFAGKSEEEMRQEVEQEIMKDLTSLQMQAYIRRKYRRFVIIKAMQDTHIKYDRDGFEWRTVQDFDFQDDHDIRVSSVETSNA